MRTLRPNRSYEYKIRPKQSPKKSVWRENANLFIAFAALAVTAYYGKKSYDLTEKYGESRDLINEIHDQSIRQDRMIVRLDSLYGTQLLTLNVLKEQTALNVNNTAAAVYINRAILVQQPPLKDSFLFEITFKNSGSRIALRFEVEIIIFLTIDDPRETPLSTKINQELNSTISPFGGISMTGVNFIMEEPGLKLFQKSVIVFRYSYLDQIVGRKTVERIYLNKSPTTTGEITLAEVDPTLRQKVRDRLLKYKDR